MSTKIKENKIPGLAIFIQWGIYLTALMPLIVFRDYISPFHFGKVIVFRSIIEILFIFYLALITLNKEYRPKLNIFSKTLLLFTGLFGVSTLFSVNSSLSFWGALERMGGLWTFIHFVVFFFIITSVFKTKKSWLFFLQITIAVGIVSAIYGFLQKGDFSFIMGSGGRLRIFGTIGNPALFAGYEIFVFFLSLTLALSSWVSRNGKEYYWGAALLSGIAIAMTAVRGALLGTAIGILIFVILYSLKYKTKIAKRILYGIVVLGILFSGFSLIFGGSSFVKDSRYLARVTDFSLKSFTVQTRFWAWQAGLEGWVETPKTVLLGWGPENFNVPFSKHFNPKFYTGDGSETLFDRGHNMFVEILVTMGLFNFLVYVFLFGALIYFLRMYKNKKLKWQKDNTNDDNLNDPVLGMGLISLIIAYMIHNFFIFDTSANFLVFFSVLGFVSFLTIGQGAKKSEEKPDHKTKDSVPSWAQAMIVILLIPALIIIYKTNIVPKNANFASTRGIIAGWDGKFTLAMDYYKEALALNPVTGKFEIREKMIKYLNGESVKDGMTKEEEDAVNFALGEMEKEKKDSPESYLPYIYASRMYILLGMGDPNSKYNDLALQNSMKALEISPTFVKTYHEIAQAYLNKQDYISAIDYFKKAVDLAPDVGVSYWYLARAYVKAEMPNKADEYFDIALAKGHSLSKTDILGQITYYFGKKDYQRLVVLYERLVKLEPDKAEHRAKLAVAYAEAGMIDQAILSARKAAELDKSFAVEAERFILQIQSK